MSKVSFQDEGWLHYLYWQIQDRKTLNKINRLDDANRLIYKVYGDETIVISCKGHYDDK